MTRSTTDETPALVAGSEDVSKLVEQARAAGRMGLDTEFMREKTYRSRLCLVQVVTPEGIYLVDPLAGYDIEPLARLVGDPDVEVIVHAGRQDLEIFYADWGIEPRRIFDVQLAAAFEGLGASLPYGRLVSSITNVTLEKGESYTDWSKRPLTEDQLHYAANDVRYLLVIAEVLKERLTVRGRLDWVQDELAFLEDPDLYRTDPVDAWRRVSGRGSLSGKQTAVLQEVAGWREETAARRDIPRGWVVKDQTLLEIARRMPTSKSALKNIRGLSDKDAQRSGDAILAAVGRGKQAPPVAKERPPSRAAQVRARTLSGLADAIVRSRCEAADLATELVATRKEIEAFLIEVFSGGPIGEHHRLQQGWRKELAGDAVVDLARGRIAVRSVDRPPYIEEVSLP